MAIKGEILHVRCIPLLPGSTSCWGLITRELSSAAWCLPMVNRERSYGLFRFITYYHRHVGKLAIAYRGFDFLLNENWLTYPTNVFLECGTRVPSCKRFCTYDSGQPSIFKTVRVLCSKPHEQIFLNFSRKFRLIVLMKFDNIKIFTAPFSNY